MADDRKTVPTTEASVKITLMNLPAELRMTIYHYLTSKSVLFITRKSCGYKQKIPSIIWVNCAHHLLSVSKAMRAEYMLITGLRDDHPDREGKLRRRRDVHTCRLQSTHSQHVRLYRMVLPG